MFNQFWIAFSYVAKEKQIVYLLFPTKKKKTREWAWDGGSLARCKETLSKFNTCSELYLYSYYNSCKPSLGSPFYWIPTLGPPFSLLFPRSTFAPLFSFLLKRPHRSFEQDCLPWDLLLVRKTRHQHINC